MSTDRVSIAPSSADATSNVPVTASNVPTTSSNILDYTKSEKHMQWWFFGPVVLAIVMFLLMGTIFERKIEALWRHILERRQAVLAQQTETDPPLTTESLHTVKTPSQRTLGSAKGATTGNTEVESMPESKSFNYCFGKKDFNKEDQVFNPNLKP